MKSTSNGWRGLRPVKVALPLSCRYTCSHRWHFPRQSGIKPKAAALQRVWPGRGEPESGHNTDCSAPADGKYSEGRAVNGHSEPTRYFGQTPVASNV